MNGTSTSAIPTSSFVSGSKRLLIGGEWAQAKSGKAFDTVNPATGEVIARLAQGDKAALARTRGYKSFVSQLLLFYASQTAAGGVQTLHNSLPGRFTTLSATT